MLQHSRLRLPFIALAGLTVTLSSCGIKPGEYSVFRVSYGELVAAPTCGISNPILPGYVDVNTFGEPQTLLIFAHEDTYYLEYEGGTVTLEGERSGKDYSFFGMDTSHVDPLGSGTTIVTTTDELTVDLTIRGKNISGTVDYETQSICSGPSCSELNATRSCSTTQPFAGSLVEDAEFEVVL